MLLYGMKALSLAKTPPEGSSNSSCYADAGENGSTHEHDRPLAMAQLIDIHYISGMMVYFCSIASIYAPLAYGNRLQNSLKFSLKKQFKAIGIDWRKHHESLHYSIRNGLSIWN